MDEDTDAPVLFCERCFAHPELITEVCERGKSLEVCPICGSVRVMALPAEDEMLRRMLRALIRLYFSEFEYNEHTGGDSLGYLLFGKNRIFDLDPNSANGDAFESAVGVIEDGWYPPEDTEVSLGGGYWDGALLFSPYDWVDSEIYAVFGRSLTTNFYELIEPLRTLLISVRADISRNVQSGLELYRARKGFEKRFSLKEVVGRPNAFVPYSGNSIGPSPIPAAGAGRFNRANVSVFYAASDEATAISEVRPEPGQIVSVGKFRQAKPMLLADFSVPSIKQFLTDAAFERLQRIVSINMVLSVPVADDARPIYLIPQLVADVVRVEGFDGIVFDSALRKGKNYAIFSPDALEYVPESGTAHVVNQLNLETSPVSLIANEDDDGWAEEPDNLASTLNGLVEMHRRRAKGDRRKPKP